jgi:hypothetical protein
MATSSARLALPSGSVESSPSAPQPCAIGAPDVDAPSPSSPRDAEANSRAASGAERRVARTAGASVGARDGPTLAAPPCAPPRAAAASAARASRRNPPIARDPQ